MKVEFLGVSPEKRIGRFESEFGNFNAIIDEYNYIGEIFECEIDIDKVLVWGVDVYPVEHKKFLLYIINTKMFSL